MYISRLVIRNFRNFEHLDVSLVDGVTCVIGENNSGKTNLFRAIRLAVDANLSSQYRQLLEHDIYASADLTKAGQVLVSLEFTGFEGNVNEHALLGTCAVGDDRARIHYRYRPRREILEDIEADAHDGEGLSIGDDYHYQITGGGKADPATVNWDEDLGRALRFDHLQAFHVEMLPALRDVTQSLRHAYESPLGRILRASEIDESEQKALIDIMRTANTDIEKQPTIHSAGKAISRSFSDTAGEAFDMGLKLGMSDPSFSSITRSLRVLLSSGLLKDFEPARNGLGLNNILYISMILEYFESRTKSDKTAGQLLLIEEPEAHLHPQLQRVLYSNLSKKPFQSIITTHSTHISSLAPVESFVTLTVSPDSATSGCVPYESADLSKGEAADLNRYLDATKSTLLYARKVILVEGPAEMFLIPPLVKSITGIDLDRLGISVVPIYGTHFKSYSKLFSKNALNKKCAIICDGDQDPEDVDQPEDVYLNEYTLDIDESDVLNIYQCPVTFERSVTLAGTLPMFLEAVRECGYPMAISSLEDGIAQFEEGELDEDEKAELLSDLRAVVLNAAVRFGKARFAQTASKYVGKATELPQYIQDAVDWIVET